MSFLLFMLLFTWPCLKLSDANDTLNTTRSMRYNDVLFSSGRKFELGFFSPGNSKNWYVGIWYKDIVPQTVVWVANREIPLRNRTSGELKVTRTGLLVIVNETNNIIWSSNNSGRFSENPVVQLLDSGNLVLRDADNDEPENYIWQSFEYPTDTILAGMDFGVNSITGRENHLLSWKTDEDPSPGDFIRYLDSSGYPQGISKKGGVVVYRSGPWNGVSFSGNPNLRGERTVTIGLYKNKQGFFYYREEAVVGSAVWRVTLSPIGIVQRWTWETQTRKWVLQLNSPSDICDAYEKCGAYGSCSSGNIPLCECLDGFVPKDPEGWARADWANGCVRRQALNCEGGGDGFLKYSSFKLPDARNSSYNESMTLEECKAECLKNCNCTAYANLDIRNGGSGCLIWIGDLVDITILPARGQDLYIRMASSEFRSSRRKAILIVSLTVGGVAMLSLSLLIYIWKRKKNDAKGRENGRQYELHSQDFELPIFDLITISNATDNFSLGNQLGEGGYGPVYKGTLEGGQDIAVKRLSKTSMQGFDEFKNEVNCIAKLQHRNLVKLLGCCLQGDELMLIYEHMPNRSLDRILFDQTKRASLDWGKRFNIINGTARGLMYLHQDSPLRIIHRDLKAGNILLDNEMNPKISDFGIARRFIGNETEDKTGRVVGTYGYMSPEYAVRGRFSIKSDVFSFGVLVLEIVSGKRNSSFSHGDDHLTLLGLAWTLRKEDRSMEFVDACLKDSTSLIEVLRVMHVGLLCVQQFPNDRPTMSTVVSMLSNEFVLPHPNPPGFFTESDSVSLNLIGSTNEITITVPQGR